MKTKISRRNFIKLGGKGFLGSIIILNLPTLLRNLIGEGDGIRPAAVANLDEYDWEKGDWGFVCDNEKCIGCGKCVVACKLENKVPWEPEYNRTWVERYSISKQGDIFVDSPNAGRDGFTAKHLDAKYHDVQIEKSFFVPKLCNQCDNPPCVTVCPVTATYMTEDGVILIDQKRCIGCRYCIQACPYGARFILPDTATTHFGQVRVADKCTWCYHRIHKGLLPACVEACPVGARTFGNMSDPESTVRKILNERLIFVLKPALGTKPKVYYVGLEEGVR